MKTVRVPSGVSSWITRPIQQHEFVTKSAYTEHEDFTGAAEVWDCIGEAGQERFGLKDLSRALSQVATA